MTPSLWMMISVSCYAFTDLLMKLLLQKASIGEILVYRSLILCTVFMLWLFRIPRGGFDRSLWGLNIGRSLCSVGALVFILLSLKSISLTTFSAIYVTYPFLSSIFAFFILRDLLHPLTLLSFGVCVAGVFMIVGLPGSGEPLIGVLFGSIAMVLTAIGVIWTKILEHKKQSKIVTQVFYAGSCLLVGMIMAPHSLFHLPTDVHLWRLILVNAFFQAFAFWGLLRALKQGQVSHLMSLEYLYFPWALLGDYIFWGVVPSLQTLLGCSVVILGIVINGWVEKREKKLMRKTHTQKERFQ
jgi:drug/metabolite transporter (DMT)-like permease